MRAYVSKITDGRTQLGTDHNHITREYQSKRNLLKFGVRPLLQPGEKARIELFRYGFDERCYGTPDETFTYIRVA